MSRRLIRNFADKSGLTYEQVSEIWKRSKKELNIEENNPQFYSELLILVKSKIGLKEEFLFLDKFKRLIKK